MTKINYQSKPKKIETIEDYSAHQLVYYACKYTKHRATIYTSLWNIILTKAQTAYPKLTAYNAAKKILEQKGLKKRHDVEKVIDYFWALVRI